MRRPASTRDTITQRREPLPQVIGRVASQCTAPNGLRRERCLVSDKTFLETVEAKNVMPVGLHRTLNTSRRWS